jgi:hypothetical protein
MRRTSRHGWLQWCGFLSLLLACLFGASPAAAAPAPQADSKPPEQSADKTGKKKDEALPLKTARKISFTTDEGTWISLDVSPDGSQIVFDLLGDLYLVPKSGGERAA